MPDRRLMVGSEWDEERAQWATPADIVAHVAALPVEERVSLIRMMLRESGDVEAMLSCPTCGSALVMQVQHAEHDGYGNETACRNSWLECTDVDCDDAGVPRG